MPNGRMIGLVLAGLCGLAVSIAYDLGELEGRKLAKSVSSLPVDTDSETEDRPNSDTDSGD